MRKLICLLVLLVSISAGAQTYDIYGGVNEATCSNTSPSDWNMQKISLSGKTRWVWCDPLDHAFIKRSVYYMVPDPSNTAPNIPLTNQAYVNSKYGNPDADAFFNNAVLRIKSWGFNTTGPGSVRNAAYSNITNKVPHTEYVGWRLADKCIHTGTCKNLQNMQWPPAHPFAETNYVVDVYDSSWAAWNLSAFAGDANMLLYKDDPYFMAGVADDTDYYKTFSAGGPEWTTDYAGQNGGHTIWYVGQSAPRVTVNRQNGNAIYTDRVNHSKQAFADFLQARYTTIGALNTAWGSSYTTFGTSGSSVTGTSLTGSGVGPYSGTLSRTTSVDRFSVLIKADGVAVGGDSGAGVIIGPGMWTAAATNLVRNSSNVVTLTVNRSLTGIVTSGSTVTILGLTSPFCRADYAQPTTAVTVSSVTSNSFQYTFAGDTPGAIASCPLTPAGSWGPSDSYSAVTQIARTSNVATFTTKDPTAWTVGNFITVANIPAGQCSGLSAGFNLATVAITAKPDSTHFSVSSTGTNLATCDVGVGAVAPAGIVDYSTGAVSGLYFNSTPSAVTADHYRDGWGTGSGILDENGIGHAYWPSNEITLSGATTAFKTDFEDFLEQYTTKLFTDMKAGFKAVAPTKLFAGISNVGGWKIPGRCGQLKGAGAVLDVTQLGGWDGSQAMADFIGTCLGDKPFTLWYSVLANPDSQWFDNPGGAYQGATWYKSTQAARATYFQNDMANYWSTCNSSTGICGFVGYDWWAYYDYSYYEHLNFGLVTWRDNAYDGHEAVAATVSCSAPNTSLTCGGEVNTYGNFLGPVKTTNLTFDSYLAGGTAPPPDPGTVSLSLTSFNFGAVTTGTTSQINITLSNATTSSVTLTSFSVSGTGFALGSSGCSAGTITAGASCQITVNFSPVAATSYSGTLTAVMSSGNLTTSLSGTGYSQPPATIKGGNHKGGKIK